MTASVDVVVFGVGGHGRECGGIVRALETDGARIRLRGFIDDAPSEIDLERIDDLGVPFLGGLEDVTAGGARPAVVLGVGSGRVRRVLSQRLAESHLDSPVVVHPDATVGLHVRLAPGVVLFPGARLTTNIELGRHAHVNQNATIGHDSILEEFVTVNPAAAVSGNVRIDAAATVGAGAVVLQGLTVGADATVGASACVVRDVLAGAVVKGVPAA